MQRRDKFEKSPYTAYTEDFDCSPYPEGPELARVGPKQAKLCSIQTGAFIDILSAQAAFGLKFSKSCSFIKRFSSSVLQKLMHYPFGQTILIVSGQFQDTFWIVSGQYPTLFQASEKFQTSNSPKCQILSTYYPNSIRIVSNTWSKFEV